METQAEHATAESNELKETNYMLQEKYYKL